MDRKIYRLLNAERFEESRIIKHTVIMHGLEQEFRYQSLRIGLIWPSVESPAYFVLGGMEIEDRFSPSIYGLVRIIEEFESEDLSLDSLFNSVTDSYLSMKADEIYLDKDQKDYYLRFNDFLDKKNYRGVNAWDVPYKDAFFRFTTLKDFDNAGSLLVDKGSPLYQDLQGLSREHLKENPDIKFYRINALSYLISGFQKSPPFKLLKPGGGGHRVRNGWMGG